MLEPFLLRALLAGVGIAVVVGPIGCFVVWRRMAYFGDSLSHSALLGVVLGVITGIGVNMGIILFCVLFSILLIWLQRMHFLANDTLLGILAHAALSIGMVVLALSGLRVNINQYLFGDILAVQPTDLVIIYGGGIFLLGLLVWLWRPLVLSTINHDLALADGIPVERINFLLVIMMTCVVAISIHILGILLITSMLIIPAAAAKQLAKSPEGMAWWAGILGALASIIGLFGSYRFDTPSGPTIIVASTAIFVGIVLIRSARRSFVNIN